MRISRVNLLALSLLISCFSSEAFGQRLKLNGMLKKDNGKPVPKTTVVIAGITSVKTGPDGRFAVLIPPKMEEGQLIVIDVRKPRWVIFSPLDGEYPLPNVKSQGFQSLKVIIVPEGSKKFWTHARIEKYVAKLSDEVAKLKREGGRPKPSDFTYYMSQWADRYGFTPDQVKEAFDEWAKSVEDSEDPMKLGLRAFYQGNFSTAAENFEKAAIEGEEQIRQDQRRLERKIFEAYTKRKLLGSSRMILSEFREALKSYNKAREFISKEKHPREWAEIEVLIGVTKLLLAERVGGKEGTLFLSEAVAAVRNASEADTREQWPREWAMTKILLGTALVAQGEQADNEAAVPLFNEADTAIRQALQVISRENWPLERAVAHIGLGTALQMRGERTGGEVGGRLLTEAVSAYRQTLQVTTGVRYSLTLLLTQLTQSLLGNALRAQAELVGQEASMLLLDEAVIILRQALQGETHQLEPLTLLWGRTQLFLGEALRAQGERTEGEAGTRLLVDAVAAYRQILQKYTREQLPQLWAMTQSSLGGALQAQGARMKGEAGARLLAEAVAAYREALKVITREHLPQDWATTQSNLGDALMRQGERAEGQESVRLLAEAAAAYREALKVRTREHLPQQWATTQNNLAKALYLLKDWVNAAEGYRNVLSLYPDEDEAYSRASGIYHDILFRFQEAYELNRNWLQRHPNDLIAQADFAEKDFTTGGFVECEKMIAGLLSVPEIKESSKVALRVIEIANALALGKGKQVGVSWIV